ILLQQGHKDEALTLMINEVRVHERPGSAVSGRLALASRLVFAGRERDALQLVEEARQHNPIPYAQGMAAWVSVCAHMRLGDRPAAVQDFQALRALEISGERVAIHMQEAVLCLGESDRAAE